MIIPQFLVSEIRLSNFLTLMVYLEMVWGLLVGCGWGQASVCVYFLWRIRVLGEAGFQVMYSILVWVVEFGELFG